VLTWLRSLFRRQRQDTSPIREEDAYAHSYGDRSGEILSIAPVPEPEPQEEPTGAPSRTGDLTGELLRRAFEAKLDARGKATA